MTTVTYRLAELANITLNLGWTGENETKTFIIDCKKVFDDYPNATAALRVYPPQGNAYPATVTKDGDNVVWVIRDSDLVYSGKGEIQLTFTEGGKVKKSVRAKTQTDESIPAGGTAPDPVQDWIDDAEAALNALDGLEVTAETLDPDESATAEVSEDPDDGHRIIAFGIPQGVQGETGATPAFSIGTVTTGAAGSDAAVTVGGTAEEPVLNFTIPQGLKGDAGNGDMLAPAYSTSATYKVGDYVTYNGGLYCCKTAITTAEAWTAAHWTSTNFGKDCSALKSAIDSYLLPTTGGTKNLFDLSLVKGATGITIVDGTTEFYGKASNMNFEISPNGIAILSGFPENQRFTVSAEAYNANATGTGLGVRCRVYYTDETDDYLFAWSRNTSEYTAKSVTTAQGKTVEKIKFNYSSGGSDIWHIKNLQIEPGTAKTDYEPFVPTAVDLVARGNSSVVDSRTENIDGAYDNLFNGDNVIDQTLVSATTRISKDTGAASSNSGTFATHFIPIREGMKLTMNKILDSANYGTAFYDINKVFIEGYASTNANKVLYAPKGAAFVRMTFLNGDLETATAVISAKVIDEAKAFTVINQKTKWIAVGDSITFGVYSKFVDGGGTDTGTFDGWVRLLAAAMNYDITVMASKGMGYTASVTGQDPEGGDTRISISTLLDRIVALEGDYNLITVSFGINDYNNPSQSTLQTILAGLDEAIQKLATRFKFARLVVITPFNSSRYGDGTTNFSYNYERSNNLSIKDIADAIKERCAYYGVECIYASNGFLLNNYNIETLLPDGVHPAKDTHAMIAKNMAHYLLT